MIYVDSEQAWGHRHGSSCHMIADSPEELELARKALGLKRQWLQKAGQPDEHYDLFKGRRARAVALGAKAVDRRELVAIIRRKRGSDEHRKAAP